MTTQLWLYVRDDGRHLVTVPGAAILAGDPQWVRVGPVEVQGVEALTDTKRLDWLLPNLHPANFGLDFPGGYDWEDDAEFLAKWRAAIDAELASTKKE